MTTYHVPALSDESIRGLNIRPEGVYVDVTFGGGGHSRAILEQLTSCGRLVGLDWDADALANRQDDERLIVAQGNFRFLRHYLAHHGYRKVDGILADLGVSSHHFDTPERGFIFQQDAPLDMRMNVGGCLTAKDVLNQYPEERLRTIFGQYGEVPNAWRLARQIAIARQEAPIERSAQLLAAIRPCMPHGAENKYPAKVFQALRLEVNQELENLRSLLLQSVDLLENGGRLVVIAYHSLEDRLVKNFFRNGLFEGAAEKDIYGNTQVPFRQVNSKVIVPSDEEISANSRARSAKLRVGERQK
jgi:16S rRNA (cytosine1402-N4)-methyltransferase